jgi:hypothetical protein
MAEAIRPATARSAFEQPSTGLGSLAVNSVEIGGCKLVMSLHGALVSGLLRESDFSLRALFEIILVFERHFGNIYSIVTHKHNEQPARTVP